MKVVSGSSDKKVATNDFGSTIVYVMNTPDRMVGSFSFPVLIDTVYGVT